MNKIQEFRKLRKITQSKLANIIGVSRSAISMYEIGQSEPDYATMKKIADYFDISIEELMGTPSRQKKKGVRIPVLGSVPAGIPIDAIEDILDYEEITEDMAKRGEYFALKVSGDSMTPLINNGDIVIIRQQEDADSGKICVVIIDDNDATLKEIKKEPNGLWVLPKNPYSNFQATFFSNEEIINRPVKILGVAVEIRRSL